MKKVLITGVGRGIGKALAQKFLREGHRVIGTSQSGQVDYTDPHLDIIPLDLSREDSIKGCVSSIRDTGTTIDILINNAGVLIDGEETHLDIRKLRETLEVNLIGTADLTERLIPAMNKDAHIVSLSSQAGSLADMERPTDSHAPYHYPAYKISKTALNMYMATLAQRLHHEGAGVIVSCIHPGWVKTDMGGSEAPVAPEEAAGDIYDLAISRPETGQFWYKGKKFPW